METTITPELLGELDPETGLFSSNQNRTRRIITIGGKVAVQTDNSSAISKNVDLLSSSLAQAQIDLDPYQFIEEIGGFSQGKINTEQQNTDASQEGSITETVVETPVQDSVLEIEKEVAITTEGECLTSFVFEWVLDILFTFIHTAFLAATVTCEKRDEMVLTFMNK